MDRRGNGTRPHLLFMQHAVAVDAHLLFMQHAVSVDADLLFMHHAVAVDADLMKWRRVPDRRP